MSEILLSINKDPIIQSEGVLGYCISLLYNHKYFNEWFYTHNIMVQFISGIVIDDGIVNAFRFVSPHSQSCALLDHDDHYKDENDNIDHILSTFKEKLNESNYIFIQINEKYVAKTKAYKGNENYSHGQLLYGYSDNKQVFFMLTFGTNNKIVLNEITFADMAKAIETSTPTLPYTFYRYNNNSYDYDLIIILSVFICYIGKHEQLIDEKNDIKVSTGSSAVERLIELLILNKNNDYYDRRLIAGFREHKQIILDFLYHFEKLGFIFDREIFEKYLHVVETAQMIESLYLKFGITRDPRIIDRIAEYMNATLITEKEVFPRIAEIIAKSYLGLK